MDELTEFFVTLGKRKIVDDLFYLKFKYDDYENIDEAIVSNKESTKSRLPDNLSYNEFITECEFFIKELWEEVHNG